MFRDIIRSTALSGENPDSVFQNISGDSLNGDVTMVSTLRALLPDRIGDGKIEVLFRNISRNHNWSAKIGAIQDVLGCESPEPDKLYVCGIGIYNDDQRKSETESINEAFQAVYKDFRPLTKIAEFYRRSFPVSCYINPDIRTTVIFVDRLDSAKLHYLECSALAFLPWYFDVKKGATELEMQLIRSLGKKESADYLACIAEFAKKYDFRAMSIRAKLNGFETRFDRIEKDRIENELNNTVEKFERLNRQFREVMKERDELNIRYWGILRKIEEGSKEDSEIMSFFLANKHLDLVSVDDDYVKFIVSGYMSSWNKAEAKRVIENPRSFLYNGSGMSSPDMKLLMEAIFVKETLKLRFCSAWCLELRGSADTIRGYRFGPEYATYMPNPHLQRFGCFTGHRPVINECLRNHDYVGATSQCIASAGSLNWSDGAVMGEFMRIIRGTSGNKAIELPDGTVVNPTDAVKWLKKQAADHE